MWFVSVSSSKTCICMYFQRGRTIAEGAKVWLVILRKSSRVTVMSHRISVPQFPASEMGIGAALTERCAGRTLRNSYEVFEYHSWEGRGAQSHI